MSATPVKGTGTRGLVLIAAAAVIAGCCVVGPGPEMMPDSGGRPLYRSPLDLAYSPDGRMLAVSDRTAGSLVLLAAASGEVTGQVRPLNKPAGVVWSADGRSVYVAESAAASVAEIDPSGAIRRRLKVGARPVGLAIAPRRGLLLAANSGSHTVSVVRLADGREAACIGVAREPYFLAVSPDEALAVVGNRLPAGSAAEPSASAVVTLIDVRAARRIASIRLPPNSMNVHGVAISPDGRWAFVAHNLGRATIATEQIEYGWINANAVTLIDLAARKRYATILVDQFRRGAANPWGLAVSRDSSALWVTLSGAHELGRLDLNRLHKWLRGESPKIAKPRGAAMGAQAGENLVRGAAVYSDRPPDDGENSAVIELVVTDMPAAYGRGVYLPGAFRRRELPGDGPRGVALSPDGSQLAIALYYTGSVLLLDPNTTTVTRSVLVGHQPQPDDVRRGEMVFHDARRCYQRWLSCATCHPDGRADGLNWDLLNDGIGNPKNTRSLLLSGRTPPAMWRGVRADMASAAAAGFEFILFRKAKPEDLRAVRAYIRSLRPAKSPHLVGGQLSEKARRGKAVFESPQVGCAACHPAPLFTDLKTHDVGTRIEPDWADRFDTPSLIEIWRTAPYLHHGRAVTLREVFTKHNAGDRHGRTSQLPPEELDALIEYVRSL